jgi:hypothetical protein
MEEKKILNYSAKSLTAQGPVNVLRSLPHIKDKITKYDAFLQNNK